MNDGGEEDEERGVVQDTTLMPQRLPYITWRRIAFHYYNKYASELTESRTRRFEWQQLRGQKMAPAASINRATRTALIRYLYNDVATLVDANGVPLDGYVQNMEMLRGTHSLHFKVKSLGGEPVHPTTVVAGIRQLLPKNMPYLVNIVIEADVLVINGLGDSKELIYNAKKLEMQRSKVVNVEPLVTKELCDSGETIDGAKKLIAPRLGVIHVIDLHRYTGTSSRATSSAAIAIARTMVRSTVTGLHGVDLVEGDYRDPQCLFEYPMYTSANLGVDYLNTDMFVTSLVFNDMGLVPQAVELVSACRRQLVSLRFMCCELGRFSQLFRAPDGIVSLGYPYLEKLYGALSNTTNETIPEAVPPNVLPRLLYVHETAIYSWQYQGGVISHLLVNTLLKQRLPKLRAIRARISQDMVLVAENVPELEYVSYYSYSDFPDRLNGRVVVNQFRSLLMYRGIRYIRFYDQIPPILVYADDLQIRCTALKSLDLGIAVVSFEAILMLLRELKTMHTMYCAINDGQSVLQQQAEDLGDQPLSESIRVLGIYIINNRLTQHSHGIASRPSENIFGRLPGLHNVQLQPRGDINRVREFFERQKKERRFRWSANVADQVELEEIDLFARTKQ